MTETKYGIIRQAKPQFPVRELLVVPHRNVDLIVSYPAFGTNTYKGNLENIGKTYSHPQTGEGIRFRPATTSESISIINPDVERYPELAEFSFERYAKPQILNTRWFQAGYIVKTQDGVFTNTTETDGSKLKQLLTNDRKVNGIYLLDNEIAFAPYESFERGVQDVDTFSQGGLAKALEHTHEKTAPKLREIGSPKFYKRGVNVWGFDPVKEPIVKVASLDSFRDIVGVGGGRLCVYGDYWDGYDGCAFGVS